MAVAVTRVGPAALCRLDDALVEQIRRGEGLGAVARSCLWIAIPALALYGATIGLWRGPAQATFASVKLVLVFGGVFALTTVGNWVLAVLLRAPLSLAQVAACVGVGIATTAAVLGAWAPISWLAMAHVPAFDPAMVGATEATEEILHALRLARMLLLGHVGAIACASILGIRNVFFLLGRLLGDPGVVRRTLAGWLIVQGLAASELSWLLRPFVGKPRLAVTFLRSDAFGSSVLEEYAALTHAAFGPGGPWVVGAIALMVASFPFLPGIDEWTAEHRISDSGLWVRRMGARTPLEIPWAEVRSVTRRGARLEIVRVVAGTFHRESLRMRCTDEEDARATYEAIVLARAPSADPFRGTGAPLGGTPIVRR